MTAVPATLDLAVQIGRLQLANPILVASGTFGYAREMQGLVELGQLGGILPKTITQEPRAGNPPWRTIETSAGMLNAIGLDNDGIENFIKKHLPYLGSLGRRSLSASRAARPTNLSRWPNDWMAYQASPRWN